MKEQSWNKDASPFIIFKVVIENPPWKNIKDNISVRKVSITYRNFEALSRNLTHT